MDSVPSESLHVGDSYERDYLPSSVIGMRSLLVSRDNIEKYDSNINTIATLESILEIVNER